MSQNQFEVDQQQEKGGCGCALTGCLIAGVLLVIVSCGLLYYAYQNAGVWVASIAELGLNQMIDDTDLPEDQKAGMKSQISRVAQGYRDGDITLEELQQIAERLAESPAFTAIPVEVAKHQYIRPSGLSDEEKDDAVQQLERVARGLFEKTISEEEFEEVLEVVADRGPDDQWQFKESLTDDEVRELVESCRDLADEAGVPDERYEVDLADELRRSIDEVLIGPAANADRERPQDRPEEVPADEVEPEPEAEPTDIENEAETEPIAEPN